MAALAYLVPPLSGLIAYFGGRDARMRVHGLQAIALGVMWPAVLYVCSWLSPVATRVGFGVMAVLWLGLMLAARTGDPALPGMRRTFERAATEPPRS